MSKKTSDAALMRLSRRRFAALATSIGAPFLLATGADAKCEPATPSLVRKMLLKQSGRSEATAFAESLNTPGSKAYAIQAAAAKHFAAKIFWAPTSGMTALFAVIVAEHPCDFGKWVVSSKDADAKAYRDLLNKIAAGPIHDQCVF